MLGTWLVRGMLACVIAGATWADVRAAGLVEEQPDPLVVRAERLFARGVQAMHGRRWDEARAFFVRSLRWKHTGSDVFYNLVQVSQRLKDWERLTLYGQGFLYRERGTKDAAEVAALVEAAFGELAREGRVPVAHRFEVSPECDVLVDGVPVADTPMNVVRLLPGSYTLTANKEDHEPWTQPLEVVAGAPQAGARRVAVRPVALVFKGAVRVTTDPPAGVEVFVDDALVGVTPLPPIELETGRRYLFRFEKAGFDRWVRYIEVAKGDTQDLKPVMEALPGQVTAR